MRHQDRVELKKAAKRSVKRHYLAFVAILVVAMILGVSYTAGTRVLNLPTYVTTIYADVVNLIHNSNEHPGNASGTQESLPEGSEEYISKNFHASDIFYQLICGDYEKGLEESEAIHTRNTLSPLYIGGVELAYNRGVLANLMNYISSGAIYLTLFQMASTVFGSPDIGRWVLVIGAVLLTALIWFFVKRVYMVAFIRLFLEGRTYRCTPITRLLFILKTRKWLHVGVVLLWNSLWQFLWTLTIVGGIIKRYSYMMVPYILAENPAVGAKEALNLSKNMMKGHKWEAFCYDLSFFGWFILDSLTLGVLGILFLYPYYQAAVTEYYVTIRARAKEASLAGAEAFNDRYLYEVPSDDLLADSYSDIKAIIDEGIPEIPKRKGFLGFVERNLGIVIRYDEQEEKYREVQALHSRVRHYRKAIKGEVYPVRLSPFEIKEKSKSREDKMHYLRHYSLLSIAMIFFSCSVVGWIWEVSLHLVTDHQFVNRGVLHGPIIPIYGYGALISLCLLTRLRKSPVATFFAAVVLSGVLEYVTAIALEFQHDGAKWWDYSGYFLNIDGKVCAEGLLVFGIGCCAGIYFLCPILDSIYRKVKTKILLPIAIVMLCIYVTDNVYSTFVPNAGTGITDSSADVNNAEYQIGGQYSIFKQWIKSLPSFDFGDH